MLRLSLEDKAKEFEVQGQTSIKKRRKTKGIIRAKNSGRGAAKTQGIDKSDFNGNC